MTSSDTKPLRDSYLSSESQRTLEELREKYFREGIGTPTEKMASLSRFLSRQNCAKFVAQTEMMRMTKGVLGSVFECGVYFGGGLMNWALLGASLEPYNYQCRVVGFDTFAGTAGITDVDYQNQHFKRREGEYFAPCYDDLQEAIRIFDADRPLQHMSKIELVRGDIRETSAQYVESHPELVVRIIHIGVNIYAPTLAALSAFLPRMAKGGIVAIDGLNYASGGCMQALREATGGKSLDLKVFDYYPNFTYFVVEG